MRLLEIFLYSFAAIVGIPAAALQDLPEGEGRQTVIEQCGSCHGLELISDRRLSREDWSRWIVRMQEAGARLDEKQSAAVLDYLARYLGVTTIDPAMEKTATRFVEGICASCHTSELIRTTAATRTEWLDIVKDMNGKGAGLSDADVQLLADYLFLKYPAKETTVAPADQ